MSILTISAPHTNSFGGFELVTSCLVSKRPQIKMNFCYFDDMSLRLIFKFNYLFDINKLEVTARETKTAIQITIYIRI